MHGRTPKSEQEGEPMTFTWMLPRQPVESML